MHAAVGPLYEVAQSPQMSEANWDPGYTHRETTNLANARLNKEQAMSSDPAKTDCREPHTRKMQRPNGPQHIRNYCIQKTNTFHYDFNAQAVRRRQKRLAASQPAPPPMFQQQAQPADGKHHVGLQASSHQPDHLQHQVKQSQAAKQDTEQLYGALLCAARDEIAAEIDAKLIAEEALAAEQSLAHKQEIRLKSVAEHQNLLETELREAHAKLTSAEKKKQQLSAQQLLCLVAL
ncbi:hypothetical protein WJX79_007545 [Trebouxia sp. C0005]